MKTLLIAGGAGFIGSNLCKALIENNRIYIIDNLSTGNINNLSELIYSDNCRFINDDICNPSAFAAIKDKLDVIINMACIASPKAYYATPISTLLTSVVGTKNLLDLAREHNSYFIQSSTSEVYGDPCVNLLKETYFGNVNCIGPRACYDEGKRAAETLCADYRRQYNLKTMIVRIFNTYGEGMMANDGRAIPEFIVSALNNQDILINGGGDQTRSFMYIDDLISAIMTIVERQPDYSLPVNLGNPHEECSINFLAELIIRLTGSKSKIKHVDALENDPYKRKPDIKRACKLLGWSPEISLQQGLERTIKYFGNID